MKRGNTWSYVIRVRDPETGQSKLRWVGGFATEDDAKAARDEARVKARRGEYIDQNTITVGAYLDEWLDSHAFEIKPKDSVGLLAPDRAVCQAAHRRYAAAVRSPSPYHQALPGPHLQRRAKRAGPVSADGVCCVRRSVMRWWSINSSLPILSSEPSGPGWSALNLARSGRQCNSGPSSQLPANIASSPSST
ncbi:hypothetical protein GCM10022214_10070 [Actinomadura miaoliensis]|uniref:AP2-like integrase N-terminal domain-containing protein n=1 Tax=Actinomadura miaoliensis TaxID=430685 RepID=A0ABP7V4P7_9ACTN